MTDTPNTEGASPRIDFDAWIIKRLKAENGDHDAIYAPAYTNNTKLYKKRGFALKRLRDDGKDKYPESYAVVKVRITETEA